MSVSKASAQEDAWTKNSWRENRRTLSSSTA